MKYSLCSISFRHCLVSFENLIHFAYKTGFDNIELWGVHAHALYQDFKKELITLKKELRNYNLKISMISGYLDLWENNKSNDREVERFIEVGAFFEAKAIRIFAADKASAEVSVEEWNRVVERLRFIAGQLYANNLELSIETHPNTLADTLETTLQLIRDVNHPNLKINLDFLHLWETWTNPLNAYNTLKPWINNFHAKNIDNRSRCVVFQPHNVYSPFGNREGIVPLNKGLIDYDTLIQKLILEDEERPVSVEWFGQQPFQNLESELRWLKSLENRNKEILMKQNA